ncbi:MAG: AAA family ATPase, partial [Thermodesulfobacteriota bacterium]
ILAPDIDADDLEMVCLRLYASPNSSYFFQEEEIRNLFRLMKPTLRITPIPPYAIMDVIQRVLRSRGYSWRRTYQNRGEVLRLREVERVKEKVLQKMWQQRRAGVAVSPNLESAALMLEQVVLPLYRKPVVDGGSSSSSPDELVNAVKKQFARFFGPCTEEEEKRLQRLPGMLKERIKGQDVAIEAICKAIHRRRKIPPCNGKPLVLFFAGPSGVGKSETATELAFHLNSVYQIAETPLRTQESNVMRVNLNRSSPNGIIGWDMTKAEILAHLLETPTTVVVLEEWDKMNPVERSCLLELLDGTQTYLQSPWSYGSTNGPYVSKECSIFIITANIGIEELSNPSEKPAQFAEDVDLVKNGIFDCFQGEKRAFEAFMSRIDEVVPFRGISRVDVEHLIDKALHQLVEEKILPSDKRDAARQLVLGSDHLNLSDARTLQGAIDKAVFTVLS